MNWEQVAVAMNIIEQEIQKGGTPEEMEDLRKTLLFKAWAIEQKQVLRVA